jgi:hypothetical protein
MLRIVGRSRDNSLVLEGEDLSAKTASREKNDYSRILSRPLLKGSTGISRGKTRVPNLFRGKLMLCQLPALVKLWDKIHSHH